VGFLKVFAAVAGCFKINLEIGELSSFFISRKFTIFGCSLKKFISFSQFPEKAFNFQHKFPKILTIQ
jgi:hypothetical protein